LHRFAVRSPVVGHPDVLIHFSCLSWACLSVVLKSNAQPDMIGSDQILHRPLDPTALPSVWHSAALVSSCWHMGDPSCSRRRAISILLFRSLGWSKTTCAITGGLHLHYCLPRLSSRSRSCSLSAYRWQTPRPIYTDMRVHVLMRSSGYHGCRQAMFLS
jgi:hypothetical protein